MSDLGDILARAGLELGGQTGPIDEAALRRVVAGARRRRVRRHVYQGVGAAAAVAVIATGGWWGAQRPEPVPAQTPTPAVSRSATPTSTPTPTVDPGPVVRETATDDATVVRRLTAPRTGETWHAPVPAPDAPAFFTVPEHTEPLVPARVGARGDATVYAVFQDDPYWASSVAGLFEVDAAGVRYIACPSPRADDPCVEPPTSEWRALAPGVVVDRDTFYDTLGVPSAVDLGGGYVVRTSATTSDLRAQDSEDEPGRQLLGEAWLVPDSSGWPAAMASTRSVARFGPAGLVEVRWKENVPGLVPMFYAWQTPLGTTIRLLGSDVPGGDFNTIVWDDGVDRDLGDDHTWNGMAQVASPGGKSCTPSMLSVDTEFDPAAWRAAGRTAEGLRVLVPVAGGNERSRAVRAWHEADSWMWDGDTGQEVTGAAVYAETGFGTDQAFLAANALFAVERPDGARLLGMIPTAASPVFECV